jgi:hypothetical protein
MHIQPISPPVPHGHHHKTNTTTEAPQIDTADTGSTDDAVAGGAVVTDEGQAVSTGSLSEPLTPETAFNTHVIGGEGEAESGDTEVTEGGHGHGKSPAHIARQLIAEGLTGSTASLGGSTEGGHQPFGQIVSQVARGLLTLEGARAAAAPAETDGGEVPADGTEVPADGGDVVEAGAIAPQETGSVEGALLDALDDATGEPAAADGTGVVEAVPAEDDTTAVVEESGETAIDIPVAEVDDGLLAEALLDMLNDEGADGEADATPDPVTDTTGEEIV